MEPRPDPATAVAAVRANEQILGVMLVLHGMLHPIGFALAFELFEPTGFDSGDLWPAAGTIPGRIVGVMWLLTGLALVVTGARMAARRTPGRAEFTVPLATSTTLALLSSPPALPFAVFSGAVLAGGALVQLRRRRAARHRTFDPVPPEPRLPGSGA